METVLVFMIVLGLALFAIPTLTKDFIGAHDTLSEGWQEQQVVDMERAETDLLIEQVNVGVNYLDIYVHNQGDTRLADFDRWDVVLQYYAAPSTYHVLWVPHIEADHQNHWWQPIGIYADASTLQAEVFEPGILNPGEDVVLRATVIPAPASSTSAMVTLSTPNGVVSAQTFVCP